LKQSLGKEMIDNRKLIEIIFLIQSIISAEESKELVAVRFFEILADVIQQFGMNTGV